MRSCLSRAGAVAGALIARGRRRGRAASALLRALSRARGLGQTLAFVACSRRTSIALGAVAGALPSPGTGGAGAVAGALPRRYRERCRERAVLARHWPLLPARVGHLLRWAPSRARCLRPVLVARRARALGFRWVGGGRAIVA